MSYQSDMLYLFLLQSHKLQIKSISISEYASISNNVTTKQLNYFINSYPEFNMSLALELRNEFNMWNIHGIMNTSGL